jgi:hypothetical protein
VRDDVVQLTRDPGALERGLLIALDRQQPVALPSAAESARPVARSLDSASSLGTTNAGSSASARPVSPATGCSSYQRANRGITPRG